MDSFLFLKQRLCEVLDNKAYSGRIFQSVVGVATVQDSILGGGRNFLLIAMFQPQRPVHRVSETFSRGGGWGGQSMRITTNLRQFAEFF